jgi:hypothetical protein
MTGPKTRRVSCCKRADFEDAFARYLPNLIPARSPRRSAGHADADLGEAGIEAARAARSAPRVGLYLFGAGLSGTGRVRRSRPAKQFPPHDPNRVHKGLGCAGLVGLRPSLADTSGPNVLVLSEKNSKT